MMYLTRSGRATKEHRRFWTLSGPYRSEGELNVEDELVRERIADDEVPAHEICERPVPVRRTGLERDVPRGRQPVQHRQGRARERGHTAHLRRIEMDGQVIRVARTLVGPLRVLQVTHVHGRVRRV